VSTLAETRLTEAVKWRRHLHANPELSFQEFETATFVEEKLSSFGLETERPTETSVVAKLRNGAGRTIALRADMDALPIDEESGVEFSSTRPGVMHACGHDMHTATLLAAAQTLVERREELSGEVRFIFSTPKSSPRAGPRSL
jgi:amidohydrolase